MNAVHLFRRAIAAASAAIALFASPAFAQQVIDVDSAKTPEIKISRKDFNRIAVFEGRVRTLKFKAGELDVNPDETTGSAFVMPNVGGMISTFVITASGQAHQVNLVPADVSAQTIILREPKLDGSGSTKSQSAAQGPKSVPQRVDRANSYDVAVKRIVGAMARNEKLADLKFEEINQEFQLWQGTRLWLISRYSGKTYTGENYRIQNTTSSIMRLDEREFYKPGVLAVSIEIHQLAPSEATDIFMVRETRNGE